MKKMRSAVGARGLRLMTSRGGGGAVAVNFRADAPGFDVPAWAAAADLKRTQAFCRVSLNVCRMGIASPTLFTCAVSVNGGRAQTSRWQSADSS